MGAASSGYNYGANKNSPGNGNGKWQGLWPSVGHARNARLINTRAGGDNRNVVFCMNQLGGVGRISNMFATTADGVQDCKNGCILPSNIRNALQQLTNYASKRGLLLGLAGVKETVKSDLPNTSGLTPFDKNFSPEMQQYVDLINGLGLEFAVTGPNDVQRHVVVMLTKTDAEKLKAGGYGFPVKALCNKIIAYGNNCKNQFCAKLIQWSQTDKPSSSFVTLEFHIGDQDSADTLFREGIEIFVDPEGGLDLLSQGVFATATAPSFYAVTCVPTQTDLPPYGVNFTGSVEGRKNAVLKLKPVPGNIDLVVPGRYEVTLKSDALEKDMRSLYPNSWYLLNLIIFRKRGPDPKLSFKLGNDDEKYPECQFEIWYSDYRFY